MSINQGHNVVLCTGCRKCQDLTTNVVQVQQLKSYCRARDQCLMDACGTAVALISQWVTVASPSCDISPSSTSCCLQGCTTPGWQCSASRRNIRWTTSHRPETRRSCTWVKHRCPHPVSRTAFRHETLSNTSERSRERRAPTQQYCTTSPTTFYISV